MPRPSRNTDRLLIRAGRELLARRGMSGLSVREVCSRAGVNLGMFHYHFKTKDEFARQVLQEMYEEFFARLSLESSAGRPRERLERALNVVGRFARDNRTLILGLLQDAAAGHRPTLEFFARNFPRHVRIVLGLVEECRKEGPRRKGGSAAVLMFVGGGVMAPALMAAALERALGGGFVARAAALAARSAVSDEGIAERVRMALRGAEL